MRGIVLKLPDFNKHTIFHCTYRLGADLDNAKVGINRIVAISNRLHFALLLQLGLDAGTSDWRPIDCLNG